MLTKLSLNNNTVVIKNKNKDSRQLDFFFPLAMKRIKN